MAPRVFQDIASRNWRHPEDALNIDKFRSFTAVKDMMVWLEDNLVGSRNENFLHTSASLHTETNTPLARAYDLVLQRLDAPERYPLYVIRSKQAQAYAIGIENHKVAISERFAALLTESELCAVLGHEVSHILSKHIRYKYLAHFLTIAPLLTLSLPLFFSGRAAIALSLRHWDRMSELSADRAGLLACQDIQSCKSALIKAHNPKHKAENTSQIQHRLKNRQQNSNWQDVFFETFLKMHSSHPNPLERFEALDEWYSTGSYKDIVSGVFYRRSYPQEPLSDADFLSWKNTQKELSEYDLEDDVDESPLDSIVEDVQKGAAKLALKFSRWLR